MSQPTPRRPRWWRVWFATAAVIPLVAGGAAITSYALEGEDAASPELSSVAPADLADAAPLEPAAEPEPLATNTNDPQDPAAPKVTASYPPAGQDNYGDWYTDGVTVTLSARATPPAVVDSIEWQLGGASTGSGQAFDSSVQVPITADGTSTITFWVSDSEGYASEPQTLTFEVDSIAPAPVIHQPTATTYRAGDELFLSFTCGDPQAWLCDFTFSNGLKANSGQPVTLTEDMTGATLTVTDFGRHVSSTAVSFTVEPAPDTTAPTLTATSNVAPGPTGWITNPSTRVDVVATDASGIALIESRRFDNGAWNAWSVLSRSADGALLFYNLNGVFTYQFRTTDVAGNVSETIDYIHRIDTEISAATVSGFPGSFEVGDSYELYYSCTDAVSGVAECSSSNGASGQPLPTDTAGEFTFTLTNRDVAGNEKTTTWSYTVGIDAVAPIVEIDVDATPNAAGWSSADVVNVTFTATDGSGIDRLWVEGTGADPLTGQFIDGDEFLFTTDVEGVTTFTAYAIDAEGNQSEPVTFELKLDRTAPTIDVTSPENVRTLLAALEQVELGAEVDVEFTCADALSGVVTCDGPAMLATEVLGDRAIQFTAVDAAGNRTTETLEYTVVAPPATEQPGNVGTQGDPSKLAHTGSEYPIWPATAFVAILFALGAWMLASARREGTHR